LTEAIEAAGDGIWESLGRDGNYRKVYPKLIVEVFRPIKAK
jgi:hypothetical protein